MDGYISIDLEVASAEFGNVNGALGKDKGTGKSWVRIEIKKGVAKGMTDKEKPKPEEWVECTGALYWDQDGVGWWEVHPKKKEDIKKIPDPTTGPKRRRDLTLPYWQDPYVIEEIERYKNPADR